MSNLVKSKAEVAIKSAQDFSPFAGLKKALYTPYCGANDSIHKMAEYIYKAFYNRNELVVEAKIVEMATEIQRIIRKYYQDLRLGEFELVMERGCFGHYGDVYVLTTATIAGWLQKYYNDNARKLAITEKNKQSALEVKPFLSDEEKAEVVRKYCRDKWVEWRDCKPEERWRIFHISSRIGFQSGRILYDYIVKFDDYIREIAQYLYPKAKEDYNNGKISKLKSIWAQALSTDSDFQNAINLTKVRAVEQYFDVLLVQGKNLD